MLRPGDVAPNFDLEGSKGKSIKLSERKREYAVLVFYPKNNTPG
jgi:peroxiredoxin